MDYAHRWTEREIRTLEGRIDSAYGEAEEEIQKTCKAYFKDFEARDAAMKARVDAGEIDRNAYTQWRLNQMGRGERFEVLRDKLAERFKESDAVAREYIRDASARVYAMNRNYTAYTIEKAGANVDFTLWNEDAVKRLIVQEPDIMPYYSRERARERGFNLDFGKRQITKGITSAILQGKSIRGIADDLQERIVTMNRTSAVRSARTAMTGAQNAGRMDQLGEAEKLGVKVKKKWLATLDKRTRHEHAALDGQVRDVDKPFEVDGYEIMYPGDRDAPAHLVYNCRCTLIYDVDGVDTSGSQRSARDPDTGKNVLVKNMTYGQWAGWKESALNPNAQNGILDIVKQAVGARASTPFDITDATSGANPNFKLGGAYTINCQRCVQAYELRRRGYDVVAKPKPPQSGNTISWGAECFVQSGNEDDAKAEFSFYKTDKEVEKELSSAPDGARYAIYVAWNSRSTHVFIAEKTGSTIRYVDPQTGNMDASNYLSIGVQGGFGFCRLDDKPITSSIQAIADTVEVISP